MKYFLDTEFLEGTQDKKFLGMKYGETKPTIDLISIGIVAEDGREYYAVSKDFNLKEAWNRHDIKKDFGKPQGLGDKKVYWIRDNVLKPIYNELIKLEIDNYKGFTDPYYELELDFTYKVFKRLIKKYGKTNKQIAKEIKDFCLPSRGFIRDWYENKNGKIDTTKNFQYLKDYEESFEKEYNNYQNPQFYGYYADYDWVVFCWLFGKMIDLPSGFPYYCKDLIQIEHEIDSKLSTVMVDTAKIPENVTIEEYIKMFNPMYLKVKDRKEYPKQTNEHNALADAIFCKDLYNFLNSI